MLDLLVVIHRSGEAGILWSIVESLRVSPWVSSDAYELVTGS